MSNELEIAAAAATLIVEEGLEYGPAKKKAIKQLGLNARTSLPGNELVHEQVLTYVQLYCSDTQPAELACLRDLALQWMERLQALQTGCRWYIEGAVWLGTATRLSNIHLQAFSPDPKGLEIAVINEGLDFDASAPDHSGESSALCLHGFSQVLQEPVGICVLIHDLDAERRLRANTGKFGPWRGDANALRNMLTADKSG